MPLIADISTGPPRQNEWRYITCQRCWIRPDPPVHEPGELADGGDDGLGLALERRLAEPAHALVGVDDHEHPVAHAAVDDHRLDP